MVTIKVFQNGPHLVQGDAAAKRKRTLRHLYAVPFQSTTVTSRVHDKTLLRWDALQSGLQSRGGGGPGQRGPTGCEAVGAFLSARP